MKHIHLRSIAVQLALLFVAVLVVSQIIGLGHRYSAQTDALAGLEAIRIADRVAALTAMVEEAAPDERNNLLGYFTDSNLPLAMSSEPWLDEDPGPDDKSRLLRELLRAVIPDAADKDIRVGYVSAMAADPSRHATPARMWSRLTSLPPPLMPVVGELAKDPAYLISIPLADGTWLNMVAAYADTLDLWPLDRVALLAGMVVLLAALSIWAIRRLTAPFGVFASAATRLGTDVNASPIAEQGPAEVRGAIREMQARLQRFISDRTQMLAAVSHDLRTPITRLRLRAEFIEDPVQRAKLVADLDDMEDMIAGALAFAKEGDTGEPSVLIDLPAMLQSICDDMADRGQHASFHGDGHVLISGRRLSLRRCFTNLIDNAVKYGVRAEVSLETAGERIVVRIDDDGPGIPYEHSENVFHPFFRLEESRNRESGGTGLGLSVARSVARAHGGEVVLADRPGGGLRVLIELPGNERRSSGPTDISEKAELEERLAPRRSARSPTT